MKIQVGKTYKDGFDRSWYIECKAAHPAHSGYPYLGTMCKSGGLNWFSEEGVVFSSACPSESSLLPNRVKKEAWGYLEEGKSYINFRNNREEAEVMTKVVSNTVLTKTIWYEDEE